MPRAEERKVPKGQERGAAQEQQNFLSETAGMADVGVPELEPFPASRISTEGAESLEGVEVGLEGPSIESDFADPLFGPTERPFEDPRTAPDQNRDGLRLQDVIQGLAVHSNYSPDILELLDLARGLDV